MAYKFNGCLSCQLGLPIPEFPPSGYAHIEIAAPGSYCEMEKSDAEIREKD